MNTASDTWMSFLQYGGYVHSQGVCSMSPQCRQGMSYSYMLTYIMYYGSNALASPFRSITQVASSDYSPPWGGSSLEAT